MDKYLSPESGNNTTIVFPSFSGRFANSVAAHNAAPDEIPVKNASVAASSRPVSIASLSSTGITPS